MSDTTQTTAPPAYDPTATGEQLVDMLRGILPTDADPLDDLTVAELGIIGRQLGCDPYAAVQDKSTGLRWEALGRIAWLWAKRRDSRAKLDPILQLKAPQITELLNLLADPEPDEDDEPAEVTVASELAENPTAPTPGSPSPARGDSTPTPS